MRYWKLLLVIIVLSIFSVSMAPYSTTATAAQRSEAAPTSASITFRAITIPPFTSLDENGKVVGVEVDLLRAAASRIGQDPKITLHDDWNKAYDKVMNGSMQALITTTYMPERKDQFKWAGPLSRVPFFIVTTVSSGIRAKSIKEAKALKKLAVMNGWAETVKLEKMGFKNLVYCNSSEEMAEKILKGDVQAFAIPMPLKGTEYTYGGQKLDLAKTVPNISYSTSYFYIAFSRDVPDEIVNAYQSGIDQILLDGTATKIKNQYLLVPALLPYGKIQLFTENNPPFNSRKDSIFEDLGDGKIDLIGSSVEVVNEIQDYLGVKNPIAVSEWYTGYSLIQYLPYSALFSTVRNAEREDLFQWVGPIATWDPAFYSLKSRNINLTSIKDVKNHTVVTVKEWADVAMLKKNNLPYITGDSLEQSIDLFLNGDADIIYLDKLTISYQLKKKGVSLDSLKAASFFEPKLMYIAFSKDTPKEVVDNWQTALDYIKKNGRFNAIWDKWYPDVPMPQEN